MEMMTRKQRTGLIGFFRTISKAAIRARRTVSCSRSITAAGASISSAKAAEAETWTQDKEGWTTCYFNRQPDLSVAAKAMGGKEDPELGGYVFDTAEKAIEAVEALGPEGQAAQRHARPRDPPEVSQGWPARHQHQEVG
jgi:hypothetical protein